MRAYGGTCPMCCGDVAATPHPAAGAAALCLFCGFSPEQYARPNRSSVAPAWLAADILRDNVGPMPLMPSAPALEGFRNVG